MGAKILQRPPISGSIPEVIFDASGASTWVEFEFDEPWVGVFGRGVFASSEVASIDSNTTAFVLSGGRGYLVSMRTRALAFATDVDYLRSVVAVPSASMYVACSDTNLFVYSESGLEWQSPRIAFDGIRLLRASDDGVEGKVHAGAWWAPFKLSVSEFEYSCEWVFPAQT